jgi:cell division protease FtsH
MALGLTQQLPIDEKHTHSRTYLLNNIAILMGGRAAEEIALNHVTTGAGNDIERATEIARKMVCEWGMSEILGPLNYASKDEQMFLGREIANGKQFSEDTAVLVDQEIKRIVTENHERARGLLEKHLSILHGVARALLERESLDGEEINQIIAGVSPELAV